MDAGFGAPVSTAQLEAMLLSDAAPSPEAKTAAAGADSKASRTDHVHPRLASATVQTTDGSGLATISFTRLFASKPAIACLAFDNGTQPVTFLVTSFAQDAQNNYTGCTVKAFRGQALPASLTLLTALVSFNVNGGSAAGVQFSCIALMPSA